MDQYYLFKRQLLRQKFPFHSNVNVLSGLTNARNNHFNVSRFARLSVLPPKKRIDTGRVARLAPTNARERKFPFVREKEMERELWHFILFRGVSSRLGKQRL